MIRKAPSTAPSETRPMTLYEMSAILDFKNEVESTFGLVLERWQMLVAPMARDMELLVRMFDMAIGPIARDAHALATGFDKQLRKQLGLN